MSDLRSTPRIVVGATRSGEGKTTVALGIMAALRRRGLAVQGFKVGPDYLDTGYQRFASGSPGRNLDLFMMGERAVAEALGGCGADIAVVEGVMGLFDGHRDGVTPTSTAEVAKRAAAPVVLVLDAAHLAASLGAVALGFRTFDPEVQVVGVILNRWGEHRSRVAVEAALARAGVEVLGYLPRAEGLELPSRHLGLVVADELGGEVAAVMERLGEYIERHVNVPRLIELAEAAPGLPVGESASVERAQQPVRMAVAWDAAFAFYYADNLELLKAHGVELVPFSPLTATELPVCDGLYLGGGYPELHASELSSNVRFRRHLAAALADGLPAYAECGGLLYLCTSLDDLDGRRWPLIGAVPARAAMHSRLKGLGYREACIARDSLLGPAGTVVRGHEFHYSTCDFGDSVSHAYTVNGAPEGYAAGDLFASYVHLHFAGYPELLEHWLERCRAYALTHRFGGTVA